MTTERVLFALVLGIYFAASAAYHVHVLTGRAGALKAAGALLLVGLAGHTAAIGVWCVQIGELLRDPGMPFSLAAYFVALAQLGLHFQGRRAALGALSLPIACVLHAYAWLTAAGGEVQQLPGSAVLRPHVLALLIGFAAFTLAFCQAIIYLVQSSLLKRKHVSGSQGRLPSLESSTRSADWLAVIGFSLLTLGIITGAMVAPEKWGPDWYRDARLVSTLAGWLIYGVYLLGSHLLGWSGRRTTYFLIAGYMVMVVAFGISVVR